MTEHAHDLTTTPDSPPAQTNGRIKKRMDAGNSGDIVVLPVDLLKVDHLYQRDLDARVVEKIAKEWDIVTAGTLVVSHRANGEYFVVDGQHRLAGAQLAGESEVLCQVIEGLTPQEEAELRIKGNFKKSDRIGEAFRARVFAHDPVALGMQAVVEEFDTKINYVPDPERGINAIAALEMLYRRDEGKHLHRVLATLKTAFGNVDAGHASSNLLKGVSWFLDRHTPEINHTRFLERMRMEGVGAIGRMARNHKAAMGGSLWINTYKALVELYNYGLRENNRLEWRTSRSSRAFVSEAGAPPRGGNASDGW